VLIVGGKNTTQTLALAEIFDPATNVWSSAASLHTPRTAHVALRLPDDTVLVAGGAGPNGRGLSSVEIYDPAADSWTMAANMSAARILPSATLLPSGCVLVAGGSDLERTAAAELFDPRHRTLLPIAYAGVDQSSSMRSSRPAPSNSATSARAASAPIALRDSPADHALTRSPCSSTFSR
jgi:hypothetical protein